MKKTRSYFYYTGWLFSLIIGLFGLRREKETERKRNIRGKRIENLFWLSYRERKRRGWIIL